MIRGRGRGRGFGLYNGRGGTITPLAPEAAAATSVSPTGFTANWAAVVGADSYSLDVSTSSTFASFVAGYNNLTVTGSTSQSVTGLSATTQYFYRVRAVNKGGVSLNSNRIGTTLHQTVTIGGTTATVRLHWAEAPTSGNLNSLADFLTVTDGTPTATFVGGTYWDITSLTAGCKLTIKQFDHLIYLDLFSSNVYWTYAGALPVGLTYLRISSANVNWTYAGALPVDLTTLTINSSSTNWSPGRVSGWERVFGTGVNAFMLTSSNNADFTEFNDATARPVVEVFGSAGNQAFSISYSKPKLSIYLGTTGGTITTTQAQLLAALQASIESGLLAGIFTEAKPTLSIFTGSGPAATLIETTFAASPSIGTLVLTNYITAAMSVANITELLISMHINANGNVPATFTISEVPSLSSTAVPGLWFSAAGVPTPLALAYKYLVKTKGRAITLNTANISTSTPADINVSGDGTGFPTGFGDWWRS